MHTLNDGFEHVKCIFIDNLILVILIIFVVIYFINNYEQVMNNNILGGNIVNSVLTTGILVLLLYLVFTWNDAETDHNYRIVNKFNPLQSESRYKLVNSNKKVFIPYNEKHRFGVNL